MGLYSWLLLVGALNGFALGLLVLFGPGRRQPRVLLACLILLISLRLAPFVLGYAGAYDVHPWLTFAPFDLSLAYGPLLWAYVLSLTRGKLPTLWPSHLVPACIQLVYWLVCFALPLDAKWAWYTGPHLGWIAPFGAAGSIASALVYLMLGWNSAGRYRVWLDETHANHDDARLIWLRALMVAFGVAIGLAAGFALTSWFITPLDYFARFPLMIGFAALTYALGLLGWRHATVQYPTPLGEIGSEVETIPASRDYHAQALIWRNALKVSELWRDENLNLAALASHLHTSSRTLSRTLSEGLGQTFREFLGRLRIEAAVEVLSDAKNDTEVLTIAFDVGFNSKASFNRAFRRYVGTTPTEWRRSARRRENRQSTAVAEVAAMPDRD